MIKKILILSIIILFLNGCGRTFLCYKSTGKTDFCEEIDSVSVAINVKSVSSRLINKDNPQEGNIYVTMNTFEIKNQTNNQLNFSNKNLVVYNVINEDTVYSKLDTFNLIVNKKTEKQIKIISTFLFKRKLKFPFDYINGMYMIEMHLDQNKEFKALFRLKKTKNIMNSLSNMDSLLQARPDIF